MKQQHQKLVKCQLGLSWVLLRNVIAIVGVPTNLEFCVALLLTFQIRFWKARPSYIHRKIANSSIWRNQQKPNITEEDERKLKNIYIDLILKKIVVLVFTWSLAYLNGNTTSYCNSSFKYWSIYDTFLKS